MSDILAKTFHRFNGFLDWLQEIKGDEDDSWIGPEIWQWTSGCDDDFAPIKSLVRARVCCM